MATWMNGDASALLLPPQSFCLWGALCSHPWQHALLLGAVAATGIGDSVPKKPGEQGEKMRQEGEKGDGN